MTAGNLNQDEAPRRKILSLHILIRWCACLGTAMLLIRRVLYLNFPDFLPSKTWAPHSTSAKWAGIAVNGITELILQLILLGLPICLYVAASTHRGGHSRSPLVVDAAFSGVLYGAAYFLLAQPVR